MSGIGYGGVVDYAPVTSATATREMAVTGMGDGGVCVGGPSLVLNFGVSPTGTTSTLDPRITFSRASNATYFDSTGTLQYAPHNLLTYSEQLDNAAWVKASITVTANTTAAPDGTTTAELLVLSAGLSTKYVEQSVTTGAQAYTFSVFVKSGGHQFVQMRSAASISAGFVNFDVLNGVVGTQTTWTGSITAVGNGWFRLSCSTGVVSAATATFVIQTVASNTASRNDTVTGDGTSGVYVWGAQLNVGALQPYYSTTVKNLQGYTQEFNNAAWTKTAASVSADATVAPDGSFTADKIVEDGTNAGHYVTPAASNALTLNQIVTYSVYAKAAERTFIQLILTGIGSGASNYIAGFNLSTGVAGTPSPGATSSIVDVGNGWYRCRLTVTVLTAATPTRQIRLALNANATASSYTGDGTSGAFIWGAQFSDSGSLDAYTYNPVAAPSAAAYYGPRIEYDPTTLAVKGLLIEEQRTNSIRNNTMQGAVAGSPGTVPTNWVVNGSGNGITRTIVGTGVESGITYIDVKYSGTSVASGNLSIASELNNQISASQNQVWTYSCYYRLVSGSFANTTSRSLFLNSYNSSGNFDANATSTISTFPVGGPTGASLNSQRYVNTGTLSSANTAFVNAGIFLTYGAGAVLDFTIRVGLPQIELGTFATSVIPTATTALTRSADVVSMQGANFSNWYNPVEGTIVVNATVTATTTDGTSRVLASIGDSTTFNETIYLSRASSSANITANVVDNGSAQWAANTLGTATVNVSFKASMAYKLDDLGGSLNGAAAVTDTSATIPTVNALTLGNGSWNSAVNYMNGYIRSFSYYPTRLPNAALRALTS